MHAPPAIPAVAHDESRIDRRQRLIAALLLAFCIDTLRPAVATVAHHHAGSDQPHVHLAIVTPNHPHARSLLAGAGITPRRSNTARRTALVTSTPSELHVHLVRTLQLAHVASSPPLPGPGGDAPLATADDQQPRLDVGLPGNARSPPLVLSA